MNENVSTRREWVKNSAIIFLSVMLVLTFFSNTFMNYSLPEVATKIVERNTITAKIRGTGNVEATDPYTVKVTESRVISSVPVKQGDEIEKDDVLYYLEDAESEELKTAQKELDDMVLAYMMQLFDGTTTPSVINKVESGNTDSFNAYQAKIADIQNRIQTAENTVTNNQTVVDNLNKQIKLLENNETTDTTEEQQAVDDARIALQKAQSSKTSAENKITEIQGRITDLETKVKEAADLAGGTGTGGSLEGGIHDILANLDQAKILVSTTENDLLSFLSILLGPISIDDAVKEEEVKQKLRDAHLSEDDVNEYVRLLNGYKTAQAALTTTQSEYDSALNTLNKYNSYVNDLANAENELVNAKDKLNSESKNESNAQNALTNAEAILANKTTEGGNDETKRNINQQLIEAESALLLSKTGLELVKAEQVTLLANIQAELDLDNKNDAIALKKEEIEKLKEKSEGAAITAPVAGTVTSLSYVAGDTLKPEEAAAVIQVAGKGFTTSFSVSNEQSKKVQVGDVAELQNSWYYNDLKVILSAIKPDPDNPGQKKLLVFDIEGSEVKAGESLNLSVGQRSQEYELVVPNSALRKDANGSFILTVESRNSPLGNRFFATRVDVEVLAEDDNNTAISGALYGYGEYVITTATKPVEAGKQVRLAD